MALADKDILITPNRGQTDDPKIEFKGADVSLGPQTITARVYPTSNGTLSFEGSAGQLFSITNSLSGTIFSVNDVSGIPSIEVLDSGLVKLAQYSGNILVGTGTNNGTDKLQVNGDVLATTFKGALTGNATTATTLQTARTINGVSFNGSANITVTANTTNALTISTGLSGTSFNGSGAVTIALASGYGDTQNPYASKTANNFLAAPNGSNGVPTFRAIVAADIPTLNQNTTGSAATLTTTRAINGVNFNGSAAITVPGNFTNRTTNESGHLQFIGTTATGNQSQYTNTNLRVNPATATVTSQTGAFAAPFLLNANTISTSYSIPSGYNAVAAGPVVINNGITVTIPEGSTWVIV